MPSKNVKYDSGLSLLGGVDLVYDAVFLGLVGAHVAVAVGVLLHLGRSLAGVLGEDFV